MILICCLCVKTKFNIQCDDHRAYLDGVEIDTHINNDDYGIQVDFIQIHKLKKKGFSIVLKGKFFKTRL